MKKIISVLTCAALITCTAPLFKTQNINDEEQFTACSLVERIYNRNTQGSNINTVLYEAQQFTTSGPPPVTSLLASETYGDWDPSYSDYNCYAYAIGLTTALNPGGKYTGENIFDIKPIDQYTLEQLTVYVTQDLYTLGYNCVRPTKNSFTVPQDNAKLICIRKTDWDYHFMKYNDGDWYHKPGNSWVLRYLYTPSSDVPWYQEACFYKNGRKVYKRTDNVYDGDIYFINYAKSHSFGEYTYKDVQSHYKTCNSCKGRIMENHTFRKYPGKKICTGCYYTVYNDGGGNITMEDKDDTENI